MKQTENRKWFRALLEKSGNFKTIWKDCKQQRAQWYNKSKYRLSIDWMQTIWNERGDLESAGQCAIIWENLRHWRHWIIYNDLT